MSTSRILAKTAAMLSAALLAISSTAAAQRFTLELKGGAAATSTINSQAGKSIADSRIGIQMGTGLGYMLPCEYLRAYGECYFSAKGEKYPNDAAGGEFKSDISYFSIYPNLRYYTPYIPVYAGAGLYFAGTACRKTAEGDTQAENSQHNDEKKRYKAIDIGPKAAIGTEIGVGSVRLTLEASYEYGLVNISKIDGIKIKNQTLSLCAGISFMLTEKRFKHY